MRHPWWWKGIKVVEVVRGVNWTVGEMLGLAMLGDEDEKDNRKTGLGWGKALVLLHNLATEITDYIMCRLDQPTITLLRKVRRVVRGDMVEEGGLCSYSCLQSTA